MERIPTDRVAVLGVTSVGKELFVLLSRHTKKVAVHSTSDYRLLRDLHLPGLKTDCNNDLTSCVRHRCLYLSDYDYTCVHRYDLASRAMRKWSVPGSPYGLSVTPSCNVLVTCREPNKLVELSADSGQCVREIALQSDIKYPRHAVQLTTGQYVVCHGFRVCIVNDGGRVTRSYGGQRGSGVGQLYYPRHLAVDEHSQFIFVADVNNSDVLLLNRTLEFVRYISKGLPSPSRLYLDHTTQRLYVGQRDGGIVVIQLQC